MLRWLVDPKSNDLTTAFSFIFISLLQPRRNKIRSIIVFKDQDNKKNFQKFSLLFSLRDFEH